MTKKELQTRLLKKIAMLQKKLAKTRTTANKKNVTTVFKSGSKNELGYGWGGNFTYRYIFDKKPVSLAEMSSLVKKNCKAIWTEGMDRHGFYPIRKLAAANGGKAIMKVGSHTVAAIGESR